jgi:eukaryotic-like serine/threonine-protein kinase
MISAGTKFTPKLRDGSFAPAMVVLPEGEFMMGSNDYFDEKPIHKVTISKPFAMSIYPVTFDDYDKYCEATGTKKPSDNDWGRGKRPTINIRRDDVQKYCRWLTEQTGYKYRSPTEAEWEYACRAGSSTEWCFGDDESQLKDYAWYRENSDGKTHPVGEKNPNQFGLYDMHGNVWEYCEDDWYDDYDGVPTDGSAWKIPKHSNTNEHGWVLRGGSWGSTTNACRSHFRFNYNHDYCRRYNKDYGDINGIRLVCDVINQPL